MDISNFKLLKEDSENYHIAHPSGKALIVSKKGLGSKAHKYIEKMKSSVPHMYEGETVPSAPEVPEALNPEPPAEVPQALSPSPAQQAPEILNNNDSALPQPQVEVNPAAVMGEKDILEKKGVTVNQALEEQKKAQMDVAKAKQQEDVAGATAIKAAQKQIESMPTQQQILDKYQKQDMALKSAYDQKQIDPDRYYKSQSVPAKLGAAIGMIISGFGSGLTGQPNMAMELMKRNVDNDIEAQKLDKDSKMNLWKMNHQAMGDEMSATLATQNQLYTGVKYKLEQAALQAGTPLALANARNSIALIDQQIGNNNFQRSLIEQGTGQRAPGGGFSGKDPSVLVPQLIKDPGAQKAALEEIKNASNVGQNGPKIMEAFDKASKENTVSKTGFGLFRTPGSVMALHQLMLPNFKSIDGTVRQAAMDESFHNLTPAAGDSDAKIAQKRQALQDWLHSESAAPTNKAYGIDLSKFENTAVRHSAADPAVRAFMEKNPGYSEDQSKALVEKYKKSKGK